MADFTSKCLGPKKWSGGQFEAWKIYYSFWLLFFCMYFISSSLCYIFLVRYHLYIETMHGVQIHSYHITLVGTMLSWFGLCLYWKHLKRKISSKSGIWTHDLLHSRQTLYHWAIRGHVNSKPRNLDYIFLFKPGCPLFVCLYCRSVCTSFTPLCAIYF